MPKIWQKIKKSLVQLALKTQNPGFSGTRCARVEIMKSYFVDNEIKNGRYANFYEVGSIFFNPICYNRIIETFPCFVKFTLFHAVVDVCKFAIFLNRENH